MYGVEVPGIESPLAAPEPPVADRSLRCSSWESSSSPRSLSSDCSACAAGAPPTDTRRERGRTHLGPTAHCDPKGPLMPPNPNPTSTTEDALMRLDDDGGPAASP